MIEFSSESADRPRHFLPLTRAFSSEVDTGSREENASKQKDRAPFRYNRNGKGSGSRHRPHSVGLAFRPCNHRLRAIGVADAGVGRGLSLAGRQTVLDLERT